MPADISIHRFLLPNLFPFPVLNQLCGLPVVSQLHFERQYRKLVFGFTKKILFYRHFYEKYDSYVKWWKSLKNSKRPKIKPACYYSMINKDYTKAHVALLKKYFGFPFIWKYKENQSIVMLYSSIAYLIWDNDRIYFITMFEV